MELDKIALRERAARGHRSNGEDEEQEERRRLIADLQKLAASPEGKRFLRWLTGREPQRPFLGNSQDAYFTGRRHVGEELQRLLKSILPRETYLEIIYPKERGE